jgi:pseudaminic acid cytidylyltransferase
MILLQAQAQALPPGRRLAVIPARGGSKRIPRKNVKPFAGRPMIAYAIAAAREAGVFAHIVVSTDDDEIAAVARAEGAEVPYKRPAELADDHAGTVPVVAHALRQALAAGWPVDQVCCIYPGVPLLRAADLRAALALLDEGTSPWVFPLLPFGTPVQRALRRDAEGRVQPLQPEYTLTRTQDLEPAYHDAGQFYWGSREAWLSGTSPHQGGRTLVLSADCAVDIDTPADWAQAELLYRLRQPALAASPSAQAA